MRVFRLLLPLIAVTLLSGCYAHFKAPTLNLTVPLSAETGEKAGAASCQQILWVFGFGDCSVDTAMKRGSIERIHHVDSEVKMIFFGAFSELTIRAWGE